MSAQEASARGAVARWCEDAAVLEKFDTLADLLRSENDLQNLVSAGTLDQLWHRHFLDSAQLLGLVPRETTPWLDLGTGAGFPGLVLAVLQPGRRFHLVESRPLRSAWLERASQTLQLQNVTVVAAPLEKFATTQFAVISARAFAPLPRLIKLAARFSTSDTTWVLPKGRSAAQELETLHGWDHSFHVEQSLTDPDAGILVGRLTGKKGR